MRIIPKNILMKHAIAINPVLQRVRWNMNWGMGNQASLPKQLRYRKYFNISDAPPEAKMPNPDQDYPVSQQVKAVKMSRRPTIVMKNPYQNIFNMSKMVSLGIPRSFGSSNDAIGLIR